jgi:hypothetical protein
MQTPDKSLPPRDHSRCTDDACNVYQIDMGNYQHEHQTENCTCDELVVNDTALTSVLLKDEKFPILKSNGDQQNLDYEIVESGSYIAISHVWADGLGNPDANSLPKCKLFHLQRLVKSVTKDSENGQSSQESPLIWLDTLCCPAQDGPGKQTAIEKIRFVYRKAQHVLVLDAGLMSYDSKSQEWPELLA